jgi:hypothetical protein
MENNKSHEHKLFRGQISLEGIFNYIHYNNALINIVCIVSTEWRPAHSLNNINVFNSYWSRGILLKESRD